MAHSGTYAKTEIREAQNRQAKSYDELYGSEQRAKHREALKLLSLEPGGAVLDVGCGTGLLFELLKGRRGDIFGLDISEASLKVAKAKFSGLDNLFLVCADAEFIPFVSNLAECTFCFTAVHLFGNPLQGLREMLRVTKPGGKIVVSLLKAADEKLRRIFFQSASVALDGEGLRDYLLVLKSRK